MIVQIQIRNVYGEEKAYPKNHAAQCLADIAGTKTLTHHTLRQALSMGCTIVELDRHERESRRYAGAAASLPATC
jgi:hypothetical protein